MNYNLAKSWDFKIGSWIQGNVKNLTFYTNPVDIFALNVGIWEPLWNVFPSEDAS
jgi:hypothetical protein